MPAARTAHGPGSCSKITRGLTYSAAHRESTGDHLVCLCTSRNLLATARRVPARPLERNAKDPAFTGAGKRAGGHGPEHRDWYSFSASCSSAGDDVSKYAGSKGLSISPDGDCTSLSCWSLVRPSDECRSNASMSAKSPHSAPLRRVLRYDCTTTSHSPSQFPKRS